MDGHLLLLSTVPELLGVGVERIEAQDTIVEPNLGEGNVNVTLTKGDEGNADVKDDNTFNATDEYEEEIDLEADHRDRQLADLSSNRSNPLLTKMFQKVLSELSSYYEKMPHNIQFAVGAMSIKMRDLVVGGVKNAEMLDAEHIDTVVREICHVHNSAFSQTAFQFSQSMGTEGIKVVAPDPNLIRATPKKRLASVKKKHVEKLSLKFQSGKVLTGVNINTKAPGNKCSFCGLHPAPGEKGHDVRSCGKRKSFQNDDSGVTKFKEYNMNDSFDRASLSTHIENNIVISGHYRTMRQGVFNQLEKKKYNYSCVINQVEAPVGDGSARSTWSVRELIYQVHLIGKDGEIDALGRNIWITGEVMNDLIKAPGRGQRRPPKFIYDHSSQSTKTVRGVATHNHAPAQDEWLV